MKRFLILIGLLTLVTCQPKPKQAEFVVQDYSILFPARRLHQAYAVSANLRPGFDGAVLSWNIMEAPDSHIACLGK